MRDAEINTELQIEISLAKAKGAELDAAGPRAVGAWYNPENERIMIELNNGVEVGIPYGLLQGLMGSPPEVLAEVEVTPSGYGLHWESLDVDLAVPQLMAGIFGSQAWMTELGRRGGHATTAAKARASRENGKRGGRPRKNATQIPRNLEDV
jgi:Protein of unknown function (DUF2442)